MTDPQHAQLRNMFKAGYRYAQAYNASLAGVYPDPVEPTFTSDAERAEFYAGMNAFHEEMESEP